MKTIKDNIINKIKAGEIAMKPRWHFVLKAILFVFCLVVVALLTVYLFSFVMFVLHQTGVWFAPMFGIPGMIFFAASSPWIMIGLTVISLFLVYILLKRYSFSYRQPLLFSMLAIIFFVTLTASFIQQTSMHDRMHSFSKKHQILGFAPLYERVDRPRPDGMVIGQITEIQEEGFKLVNDKGEAITVFMEENNKQIKLKNLNVGDRVMVFGKKKEEGVEAFGVRFIDEKSNPHMPMFGAGKGQN